MEPNEFACPHTWLTSPFLLTCIMAIMYAGDPCVAAQNTDQATKDAPPSPSVFTQMRHALSGIPGNEAKVERIDEFLASDSPHISVLDRAEALLLKTRYLSDREEKTRAIDRAIAYTDESTHRYLVWNIRAAAYAAKVDLLTRQYEKFDLFVEMVERYGISPDLARHEFNRVLAFLNAARNGDSETEDRRQQFLSTRRPSDLFGNISVEERQFRARIARTDDIEEKKRLYDARIEYVAQLTRFSGAVIPLMLERADLEDDETKREELLDRAVIKLRSPNDPSASAFDHFFFRWLVMAPDQEEKGRRFAKAVALYRRHAMWVCLLRFLNKQYALSHQIPGLDSERDTIMAELAHSNDPDIRWEVIRLKMSRIDSMPDLAEKIAAYDELISLDFLTLRQKVDVFMGKIGVLPDNEEKNRLLDEIAEEVAASDDKEGPYCAAYVELEKVALLPDRQERIARYREFIERFGGIFNNRMSSLSIQARLRLQDELHPKIDVSPPPDLHTLPMPPALPLSP